MPIKRHLQYTYRCWLLSLSLLAASLPSLAATQSTANPAPIGLLPDINRDYHLFMGQRSPQQVDFYGGAHARRDVVELVLLQQALLLGGFNQPLEFIEEENYSRSIRNVLEGKTLTMSGTIWQEDLLPLEDKLFISPPLVRDGEFLVGLYTSPGNRRALASQGLGELTQLRVVTSRQWQPDVKALQGLGFRKLMYTPNWINMARMINAGRVDMTLAPFAFTEQLHMQVEGITLVPIPGVKMIIPGSRHWPVSRKHPQGEAFAQALGRGLEQLRAQGTIERAYRESGFFQTSVNDWTLLNPADRFIEADGTESAAPERAQPAHQ